MLLPTMVVELWGLQSKPLHRTGPAHSWLLRAVSSQGLNTCEDGHFTASLRPPSHVWPLSLGEKNSEYLPFCNLYPQPLISLLCTAEKSLALPSLHPLSGSWSQQWGLPWEWVSPWASPLETPSVSPVFPGSTQESIRDSGRTISLGCSKNAAAISPWLLFPSQVGEAGCSSLLTLGAWASADKKLKDFYCCCPIISLK